MDKCLATIKTKKGEEIQEADIVLSSVGITSNLEGIGIEENRIELEKGKLKLMIITGQILKEFML